MKTIEELIAHLEGMTPNESAATHVGAPTVLFLCREIVALKKRIAHVEHVTGALPSPHLPLTRAERKAQEKK